MRRSSANGIAAIAAGVATIAAIFFFRMRGIPVLAGAGVVYLGTLVMLWPKPGVPQIVLPKGIRKADFKGVETALEEAGKLLGGHARLGSHRERALFERMSALTDRILSHLRANPSHLGVIQRFTRHGLARLIQMVTDYAELKQRALPEHRDRLDGILVQMETFLPALERIDRACVENDLDALEISVEVMSEQMDNSRFS